jgi:ribosome-binding protein aMBF1 (putative translation factor)
LLFAKKKTSTHKQSATKELTEQFFLNQSNVRKKGGNMTIKEIREAIIKYRKASGLSQEALAKKLSMSRNGLAKIERGETRRITLKILGKLEGVVL